eukprot:3311009-Rhodomonas_salina.3
MWKEARERGRGGEGKEPEGERDGQGAAKTGRVESRAQGGGQRGEEGGDGATAGLSLGGIPCPQSACTCTM